MRLFSVGGGGADRDPMVDLERLLIKYAWEEIADTNVLDRLFKKKKYTFEVNWSYLDITHRLVNFRLKKQHSDQHDFSDHKKANNVDKAAEVLDKMKAKILQRDLCLFRTEFSNSSNDEQTFTFKTERKTTSRCDVNIQKGYRIGANVDIRVSIPTSPAGAVGQAPGGEGGLDACRVTGGLSGELHVTKSTGQTIEECLTWGVDSQVKVERKTRVVAALLVREEELAADFSIETTIQATHDIIPVYIREKKTGKLIEMLEILSSNLTDILKEVDGFHRISNEVNNAVNIVTRGNMRAVYGAEQIIRVDQFKNHETANSNYTVTEA